MHIDERRTRQLSRRGLLAGAVGAVAAAGLGLSLSGRPATAGDSSYMMVGIKNNGDLFRYNNVEQVVGSGWTPDATAKIAGLDANSFVELRAEGGVSRWTWDGSAYHETSLEIDVTPGNTRSLAGLSSTKFLQVAANGNLIEWTLRGGLFQPALRGEGWTSANTRFITGLSPNTFLEVRADGGLSEWYLTISGSLTEYELPTSGFTSANTRAVAGVHPYGFYELTAEGTLSFWSWTTTGGYLVEYPECCYFADTRLIG